ncbi:MAG: hypothetical protein SF187_07655 [Deltaproteobacteria bacterium]|nr:hypothetical protein [Deltaproteobacteria bacterium]
MTVRLAFVMESLLCVCLLCVACGGDDDGGQRQDAAVAGFDAPTFDGFFQATDGGDALWGDAASDAATDAGADGPVRCTPSALRCEDSLTAARCAPTGDAWLRLVCPNGCANDACNPLGLATGFELHQFRPTDDTVQILASYGFTDDGRTATQKANAWPSAYITAQSYEGIEVTGKLGVYTATDDDLVGLVFGWQDPQHFYLFDWKQTTQDSPACGTANAGGALKVVNADAPLLSCADFWKSGGTTKVKLLSDPTKNQTGWKDDTAYTFRLVFRPGDIRLEIKEDAVTVVSITSKDTTYAAGRFGFYNYSQEAVRYELVRIAPASTL